MQKSDGCLGCLTSMTLAIVIICIMIAIFVPWYFLEFIIGKSAKEFGLIPVVIVMFLIFAFIFWRMAKASETEN